MSTRGGQARRSGLAAALVCTLALAFGIAQAATVDLDNREYVMFSGGPSSWEARTEPMNSCFVVGPSYTPVADGATFRNHSNHTDAFDGGLIFMVDDSPYRAPDGKVSATGNTVKAGPSTLSGLRVVRTDAGLPAGALRSLVKIANPTNSPIGRTVTWASNLGSDGSEEVRATSSGNQSYDLGDRWVVSSTDPPIDPYQDPAVTHVVFGKGAKEKPAAIRNVPEANECLTVDYDISIPAHETRYMLFFAEMNTSPGSAAKRAKAFNPKRPAQSLLRGVPGKVLAKVINWDLG